MKNHDSHTLKQPNTVSLLHGLIFGTLLLIISSCSQKTDTYSILELSGTSQVMNYSKSFLLWQNVSKDKSPVAIEAGIGDLIAGDNFIMVYENIASGNSLMVNPSDTILYVNGKIFAITIPANEGMIPWFRNMDTLDLSSLQFLNCSPRDSESYFPFLKSLSHIRPDVGISFQGEFSDMENLLTIFRPEFIIQPTLYQNDFELLSQQDGVRVLMITLGDSVINEPLPALPSLSQIIIMESDGEVIITNDFFVNNPQISRVIMNKPGIFDFSILDPLTGLRELVISGVDSLVGIDLINNHEKLDLLSVTGYFPGSEILQVKQPSLKWMTFFSNCLQPEFDSFINIHPDLEVIEVVENDTISNFGSLSRLKRLTGLIVTDTVTDIESVKKLRGLKYLSLPAGYLSRKDNIAVIKNALPDTRIAANEGYCLGSGWLLLLLPLVIVFRFLFNRAGSKRELIF